jgi:hypothetical protein
MTTAWTATISAMTAAATTPEQSPKRPNSKSPALGAQGPGSRFLSAVRGSNLVDQMTTTLVPTPTRP